jgi:hypothetical protein
LYALTVFFGVRLSSENKKQTAMPKLLSAFFFLLVTMSSFAQIKKNDFLVGGQLSYNYWHTEQDNYSQTQKNSTIDIIAGKAIRENRVAGILLGYSPGHNETVTNNDTEIRKDKFYSVGGFYRAYNKIGRDFYFFAELSGAYTFSNGTMENRNGKATQNGKGAYIRFTPGISYQMAKKWQLEIMLPGLVALQYFENNLESNTTSIGDSKSKNFTASSSLSNPNGLGFLGVGFKLIL